VRFDAFGYVRERIHEREVAYCLPLPRMAYGRLGRSQVGCDRQYAVPVKVLLADALGAGSLKTLHVT